MTAGAAERCLSPHSAHSHNLHTLQAGCTMLHSPHSPPAPTHILHCAQEILPPLWPMHPSNASQYNKHKHKHREPGFDTQLNCWSFSCVTQHYTVHITAARVSISEYNIQSVLFFFRGISSTCQCFEIIFCTACFLSTPSHPFPLYKVCITISKGHCQWSTLQQKIACTVGRILLNTCFGILTIAFTF